MDFRKEGEGILMAPGRAIPRLLARHGLRFSEIALFEIHEAFAAQVLGNVKAASDPVYRHEKAHVAVDLGPFALEPRKSARRLVGVRTSVRRDRRADPEPGRQGVDGAAAATPLRSSRYALTADKGTVALLERTSIRRGKTDVDMIG